MKNLFCVNFPKFEDFFQYWFIQSIPKFYTNSAEQNLKNDVYNLADVVHSDYADYKDVDWTKGKVFIFWHAPLIPLPIHSDVCKLDERIKLGHAVSFNLYNTATVNFYDINNLVKSEKYIRPVGEPTTNDLNTLYNKFENTKAIAFEHTDDIMETYNIDVNDTYIMNTVTPHQLLAEQGRIHVSVRCSHFNDIAWETMINLFKEDIKH